MEIIEGLINVEKKYSYPCIALGTFDGIHKGHQRVIKKAVNKAKEKNGTSMILTFDSHPNNIILPRKTNLITTNSEKISLFNNLDIDVVIFEEFTEEFKSLSPDEFIEKILVQKLNVTEIFVGFNYTFGKNGKGTAKYLKLQSNKYNFNVTIIQPLTIEGNIVSSTLIREKIKNGKIDEVREYLGYDYLLSGEVVHGRKIGRQLGFPTANVNIKQKSYPPNGVYGVRVHIGQEKKLYTGIMNIGINPTLKLGEFSIEVHIFDFDKDIYNEMIYINIIRFIRKEKKFSSKEELVNQMKTDIKLWKKYINWRGLDAISR